MPPCGWRGRFPPEPQQMITSEDTMATMTTQAPRINGHSRPPTVLEFPELGPVKGWPKVAPAAPKPGRARRAGVIAVAAFMSVVALGLAVYSAAASYESVSRLARRLDIPLHQLTPLGIDGGLFGVIAFDIMLTLTSRPIWWLRWTGRLFAAGVIAANAAAGWPDPVSVGLRCGAPLLFIVIVEASRTVMLGRAGGVSRDRIPRMRWLLDMGGTWSLWRRMQLWGEQSFTRAVETELERIAAIERLTMHYGPGIWDVRAPRDLVWMLKSGVRIGEAIGRVSDLLACAERETAAQAERDAEREALAAETAALRSAAETANGERTDAEHRLAQASEEIERLTRKLAAEVAKRVRGSAVAKSPRSQRRESETVALSDEAARAKARELFAADPGISGTDLGEQLGRTPRWGQLRVNEFKAEKAIRIHPALTARSTP